MTDPVTMDGLVERVEADMRAYAEAAMKCGWRTALNSVSDGNLDCAWERDWFERNPPASAMQSADALTTLLATIAAKDEREADLTLALDLACRTLGDMEPPDSRAASNEFVSLFSILCDKANEECRTIIKAAIAKHEAEAQP